MNSITPRILQLVSKPQILSYNQQSMNRNTYTRELNFHLPSKVFASIVLVLSVVIMIPITEIASGAPKFDPSPQGEYCSSLYSIIQSLLVKQAQLKNQGSNLSASDQNALNQATDEYMRECREKYGHPSRDVNPKIEDLSNLNEDMVLEQTEEPQTPKQGLSDITPGDMVIEQTEQTNPQNSDPPNTTIENNEVG